MSDHVSGALSRIARFLSVVVGRGRITTTNDGGNVQMVQGLINGLETVDNLPRLAEFGFSSVLPTDGSPDFVMVNLGSGRNNAAVIATGHQQSRPKNLKPGEVMVYSQDGKSVYLTASGGIVVEAKGQPVTVNDASNVTVNCSGVFKVVAPGGVEFDTPLVKSSGDIQDNFNTNSRTMAGMRTIYNGHKHPVENVQGGSSTIVSDVPNQTE
ncbi:phage baseplate assembly protein domain-containing protein [Paraburkholderia sp. 2C]